MTSPEHSPISPFARAATYEGASLRAVAMPLGGVGTGTVAIAGDGSLRQWQIHNQVNHLGCLPHSFFAIWCRGHRPPSPKVVKVLQVDADRIPVGNTPPPTANDHEVPEPHQDLMKHFPGVDGIRFSGAYPVAELEYVDAALPVSVRMEAMNPFEPLNVRDSGIPAAVFRFTISNPTDRRVQVSLMGTLQNAVGWDGILPIDGVRCSDYGGNSNAVTRLGRETAIVMSNSRLRPLDPANGTMVLSVDQPATVDAGWQDIDALWNTFSAYGTLADRAVSAVSDVGETYNGALAVHMKLQPGESRDVRFAIAWHFPNRTVNWSQKPFFRFMDSKSTFWLGNQYNNWYQSALDVVSDLANREADLVSTTRTARDAIYTSTLPQPLIDSVGSQMSVVRTPTCFWTEDGNFYGFEGCNGISTGHTEPWGGSCPLNCTHVWNYAISAARLYPELERSMRDTEWFLQQHPTGYLPHRVIMPRYLPRHWDKPIMGPDNPALDGLFGAILKTWREYRSNGDRAWLEQCWPKMQLAMDHVWNAHDPERTGMILGEQPNTYDISIYGANTFIGTLYLAALRVMEEAALLLGDDAGANEFRRVFALGQIECESLWNGEYYEQRVDLELYKEQNWGIGCHSDQLLGQWWANLLGLGDLLDPERIRTALVSIHTYNLRDGFAGFKQVPRVYCADEDRGLLMCSWPRGGRPEVPTLYSDEVWTGIEYEVAGLLIQYGEVDRAIDLLSAVRARYDGTRQNPWNDIECGDHYVRAMSSWGLLDSIMGYQFDAGSGTIQIAPMVDQPVIDAPFVFGTAWGTVSLTANSTGATVSIRVLGGELAPLQLVLNDTGARTAFAELDGSQPWQAPITRRTDKRVIDLTGANLSIARGQVLDVRVEA